MTSTTYDYLEEKRLREMWLAIIESAMRLKYRTEAMLFIPEVLWDNEDWVSVG